MRYHRSPIFQMSIEEIADTYSILKKRKNAIKASLTKDENHK